MMFNCPNMIIIGAADRNVGKTELACELIRRDDVAARPVAVKVTTIKNHDGQCPRGGSGCGVCTGFKGDYCLTEETSGPAGKDTTRMLAAGAGKVLWLRVHEDHLVEGMKDLLGRIPGDAAVVCESNSVRHAVEPGVFLVIKAQGVDRIKDSCKRVLHFADAVAGFNGSGWDIGPDRVKFTSGRWWLRRYAAAIVLAGGMSRRMGQDKSMMPVEGKPMIQHIVDQLRLMFDEVLVGANDPGKYGFLGCRVIPDRQEGMGPLMGIASCLAASGHDINFITACDIPEMNPAFISELFRSIGDNDAVVPVSAGGLKEPLFALCRKTAASRAETVLAGGGRRIAELFDRIKVKYVDMPDTGWYRNVNTVEEYRALERK